MEDRIVLTKSQVEFLDKVRTDLSAYIKLGATLRKWSGKADVKNPETKVKIGERETKNINVEIPDDKLAKRIAKILTKDKNGKTALSGTGEYIKYQFGNTVMQAIDSYVGKVSGLFEVQFTIPTAASKINSSDAKAMQELDEWLSVPVKEERYDVKTGEVKTNVADKVNVAVDEDDMPF